MLKLEALVKQIVLDELLKELINIGVYSLSFAQVSAAIRPLDHRSSDEDLPQDVDFAPFMKLEVILDKGHLAAVEEALAEKVSIPLVGGAEVTVMKLKEDLRILGAKEPSSATE